jgi:succinoglycan biosynthesis transport protein ExoP
MQETTTPNKGHGGARDFLAVLFRRRWIIGSVFAVTTLTVLAINLSQPLFYESTGKVILKRGMRDNLMQPGMRTMTWEEELASEVETVESGAVVAEAQEMLDQRRKAEGKPRIQIALDRVEASVQGESNVIAMSYQDRSPEVALEVTDVLIAAYMNYRKNVYTLQYPREFFETEVARVSSELQEWTGREEAYMASTGTVNLQADGVTDKQFLSQQETDLANVEKELAQKRETVREMRAVQSSSNSEGAVSSINDGVISALKQDLAEARVRYREMETIYVPTSQELVQMKSKVDEMEAQLATEVNNRIRLAEVDLRALEAKAALIRQSVATGRSRLATYPQRTARMSEIELRIAALTKNYEDLTRAAAQAKISKATSPDWTVDLLTPAGKPYAKNQRDYVRLALAPIFSLIVGLGLAFFIDGLDATLKSPRETEEALDLPVLASLTEHKERRA